MSRNKIIITFIISTIIIFGLAFSNLASPFTMLELSKVALISIACGVIFTAIVYFTVSLVKKLTKK